MIEVVVFVVGVVVLVVVEFVVRLTVDPAKTARSGEGKDKRERSSCTKEDEASDDEPRCCCCCLLLRKRNRERRSILFVLYPTSTSVGENNVKKEDKPTAIINLCVRRQRSRIVCVPSCSQASKI